MTSEYVNLNGKLELDGSEYDPMKHLPLINPLEQRALALKLAIDATGRHFDFGTDAGKGSQSDQMQATTGLILQRAKAFSDFISSARTAIRDASVPLDDEL